MPWHTSENLLRKRMAQHGLTGMLEAGFVCRHAEELYPGLFQAVSVKGNILHLELGRQNAMPFKLIEGRLFAQINQFALSQGLPKLGRIRLTFSS